MCISGLGRSCDGLGEWSIIDAMLTYMIVYAHLHGNSKLINKKEDKTENGNVEYVPKKPTPTLPKSRILPKTTGGPSTQQVNPAPGGVPQLAPILKYELVQ